MFLIFVILSLRTTECLDATNSTKFDVNSLKSPAQDGDVLHTTTTDKSLTDEKKNNSIECSCEESNATLHLQQKANIMQEQIKNKTGLFSKIHHRATHSEDALWASITLSALLVLLFVAVLHSRMWQDRSFISYTDSQPVRFERFNRKSEISTKEMLRSRARNLAIFFRNRRSRFTEGDVFNMQNFLEVPDTVDSKYKAFLESSSSEDEAADSSDSGEDTVFRINKYTGEWEGDEDSVSLLRKDKKPRRRKVSRASSTSSIELPIDPYLADELELLSSSEEAEEERKALIRIG